LTERVRRRPYCVILLDEIEKAHADVYNVLLQVFDDGRLTDGKGRVVDFSNTLIIATSNLASDLITGQGKPTIGFSDAEQRPSNRTHEILAELRRHFRREFINRIDEVIIFKPLDKEQVRSIVRLQLKSLQQSAQGQDIALEFDDSAIEHLAAVGFEPEFGAREIRRQIRQRLEFELAKQMLAGAIKEGDRVLCKYDQDGDEVRFSVIGRKDPVPDAEAGIEDRLDEALEESFPASDPPAVD
jgi:ATP-dependent Clp protease ATP-binding subunit ClpC